MVNFSSHVKLPPLEKPRGEETLAYKDRQLGVTLREMRQDGELCPHGDTLLDGLREGGVLLRNGRLQQVVLHRGLVDEEVGMATLSHAELVEALVRSRVSGIDDLEI